MAEIDMCQLMKRLDNVEKKLDKISEAMVLHVRTEERVVNLMERNQELHNDITSLKERITKMEGDTRRNSDSSRMIERGLWVIFSGAIGLVCAYIGKLFN